MKKFLLFVLLVLSLNCYAQTTTVSATVVDQDSATWINGTWGIDFTPSVQFPNPNQYQINGTPLSNSVLHQSGSLSNTGVLSVVVYNSSQISPSGSSWTLRICPLASAQCSNYIFGTSGSSMNISSNLTAIIGHPRFACIVSCYGYSTIEVNPNPVIGANFFNTTSGSPQYWNGSGWVGYSGSLPLPLAGGGTNIATGPGTSTNTDVAIYTGTQGQLADSGTALSALATVSMLSSYATIASLAAYAPLASPNFTGNPTAPTQAPSDNSTKIASTAFVQAAIGSGPFAPINSPTLTGTPKAPIDANCDDVPAQIATEGYVANCGGTGGISPSVNVYNTVVNGSFDNSGGTDESTATATLLTSGIVEPIYFPAGVYNFNSGMLASCTSSICAGLNITGAGKGKTIFQSNCANGFNWWINLNNVGSGSYWLGPQMSGISFQDTSGTGACSFGLRLTQMANFTVRSLEFDTFKGQYYHTGNITVTNGTTAITGSGTTFTNAMLQQTNQSGYIGQAILIVNGTPQFICSFTSATRMDLCMNWQGATTTTSGANQWDIAYGGTGLLLDGGSVNYVQYGQIYDLVTSGSLRGIGSVPKLAGTSAGTSRFWIIGGFINPLRYQDSMCTAWGDFTDTVTLMNACNNAAWGDFWENSHDNDINNRIEQDNTSTAVYSCNAGTAAQSCTVGHEFVADTSGHGYGNSISRDAVYGYGTALKVDSTAASFIQVNNPKWMNSGGASANLIDFSFGNGGTFANGCPGNASGNHATIIAWNCVHYTSTPGVN